MTRVGIITQARMTSTRLPGKVLLEVAGRTMLDYHLTRLEASSFPVIVATTTNSTDDPIAEAATKHGVSTFRGSEHDVLSRFAGAAEENDLDVVVRVTADCPLIDGDLVRQGVGRFLTVSNNKLYLSNTQTRTFPRGFDFEVFSRSALLEANEKASHDFEREHVTPYFYADGSDFLKEGLEGHVDSSQYRVTLDTSDDFELIRTLIEDYRATELSQEEIVEVLDSNPDLSLINAEVVQKRLDEN